MTGTPVTKEQRERIVALYDEGYSYAEVARLMDLGETTVGRTVRNHGTPRPTFAARNPPPEFWARLGRQGGTATAKKHGREHYAKIGRLGGRANVERHPPEHFQALGKQAGERLRELIRLGREMEKLQR